MTAQSRILIVDYGSQYTQLIARRVREARVYSEIHPPTRSLEWIRNWNPTGIILSGGPNVVQVVPLTRTIRTSSTEILIDPDEDNRLVAPSSAQCQHVRSVATTRIHQLWQCRTRGPQRGPRDAGAAGGPVAARGS